MSASAAPARYEAHARVLVGPLGGEAKTLRAASQLTETYAQLAMRRPLLDATAAQLGLHSEPRVRVQANSATRILAIVARDGDARRAARIANAQADQLIAFARAGVGGARAGRLHVVERAVADRTAVGPPAGWIAALAALAGLLSALVVVLLLDRSRTSVSGSDDVVAATGAPCVGVLSRAAVRAARAERPVVEVGAAAGAAAEFGVLAAKLDAAGGQSLLVIALHGDAPALARNLAEALAAHGSRVALVDVGRDAADGAGAGDDAASDGAGVAVRAIPRAATGAPGGGHEVHAALADLEADADVVVLHAWGLERSPTALAWAQVADGTILVAQRDRTAFRDLRETATTLRMVGAPILGTVLAEPATALPR
jgi:capsular polysaccharide biosynthesis protein